MSISHFLTGDWLKEVYLPSDTRRSFASKVYFLPEGLQPVFPDVHSY